MEVERLDAVFTGSTVDLERAARVAENRVSQTEAVYGRFFKTIERGRQQAVASSIAAAERESSSVISGLVKQANAAQAAATGKLRAEQRAATEVERINAQTARQAEAQEKIRERAAKSLADVQIREARRVGDALAKANAPSSSGVDASSRSMSFLSGVAGGLAVVLGQQLLRAVTSLVSSLAQLPIDAFKAAASFDALKRGLIAVSGSTEEADRQLIVLREIAKAPGIGFREAIEGAVRLEAVGFSAAKTTEILKQFANAIATTGGGREELAQVTIQLGQMAAKGKVLAQDLKPIIEASPAVGRALKEMFGTVSSDDIQQHLEKLHLTSEDFINMLVAKLGELPRVSGGAKNSMENLADSWDQAMVAFGNPILDVVSQQLDGLSNFLNENQAAIKAWGEHMREVGEGAIPIVKQKIAEMGQSVNANEQDWRKLGAGLGWWVTQAANVGIGAASIANDLAWLGNKVSEAALGWQLLYDDIARAFSRGAPDAPHVPYTGETVGPTQNSNAQGYYVTAPSSAPWQAIPDGPRSTSPAGTRGSRGGSGGRGGRTEVPGLQELKDLARQTEAAAHQAKAYTILTKEQQVALELAAGAYGKVTAAMDTQIRTQASLLQANLNNNTAEGKAEESKKKLLKASEDYAAFLKSQQADIKRAMGIPDTAQEAVDAYIERQRKLSIEIDAQHIEVLRLNAAYLDLTATLDRLGDTMSNIDLDAMSPIHLPGNTPEDAQAAVDRVGQDMGTPPRNAINQWQNLGQQVSQIFQNSFGSIRDGWRSLMANLLEGFSQLLIQLAVKALAAWVLRLLGGGLSGGLSGGMTHVGDIGFSEFAEGGRFSAGDLAVVGEHGPELVGFDRPGRVFNQSQLAMAGAGGGDTYNQSFNFTIQAPGGRVPAESQRQLQSRIMESAAALKGKH